MNKIYSKTLGPRESQLITMLYELNKPVFKLSDVKKAMNIGGIRAANIVSRLNAKGVVSRVKQGLYSIVPSEMGREKTYAPDPSITAREIMGNKEYYISFASALQIHDMTTQPQLINYVSVKNMMRPVTAAGNKYRFIFTKKEYFFGLEDFWVTKQEKVKVSSPEKTIIDCLHFPKYCGGITEAAKAMYMKRDSLKKDLLIEYAKKMGTGSVRARLGYLMELYEMAGEKEIETLKENPGASYVLLDPALPKEGKYMNRWMLFLNVPGEELKNIGRT